MVKLTDHPDMTLDVYRGRKTIMQQQQQQLQSAISGLQIRVSIEDNSKTIFLVSGLKHML